MVKRKSWDIEARKGCVWAARCWWVPLTEALGLQGWRGPTLTCSGASCWWVPEVGAWQGMGLGRWTQASGSKVAKIDKLLAPFCQL